MYWACVRQKNIKELAQPKKINKDAISQINPKPWVFLCANVCSVVIKGGKPHNEELNVEAKLAELQLQMVLR
jgi:hypothetical protein